MIKTERHCAGSYVVRETTDIRPHMRVLVVKVHYPNDGTYWIADPQFDNNTSDPLYTKREAVACAHDMLEKGMDK